MIDSDKQHAQAHGGLQMWQEQHGERHDRYEVQIAGMFEEIKQQLCDVHDGIRQNNHNGNLSGRGKVGVVAGGLTGMGAFLYIIISALLEKLA